MIECKAGRVTNKCEKNICCMYCDIKMNCKEQCVNSVELECKGIDALNGCCEAEEVEVLEGKDMTDISKLLKVQKESTDQNNKLHCIVTVNSEDVEEAIKKVNNLIGLLKEVDDTLFKDSISVYGNYGGDFLKIMDNGEHTIHLTSAHCCVVDIEKTVPIEFITTIINEKMMEYNGDPLAVIDSFSLSDEFKEELKAKVN